MLCTKEGAAALQQCLVEIVFRVGCGEVVSRHEEMLGLCSNVFKRNHIMHNTKHMVPIGVKGNKKKKSPTKYMQKSTM